MEKLGVAGNQEPAADLSLQAPGKCEMLGVGS